LSVFSFRIIRLLGLVRNIRVLNGPFVW
jgi:hypothetical protein